MSVGVDLELTPSLEEVRELAREHTLVPLRHTFIADCETPVPNWKRSEWAHDVLPENDPALLLIQRIRDEAHRFAVTFHRKARSMRDLRSELDEVPGIGPGRRRALLRGFGSLAGVRRATREELESVVGAKTANAVIDYFARSS